MACGIQHAAPLRLAHAGHDSNSSLPSHDLGRHMRRTVGPRWLEGQRSLSHTPNKSLESLCQQCYVQKSLSMLTITQRKSEGGADTEGRPRSHMRRAVRYMWVTEVISGTGFFAVTEKSREKATEVRTALAAQLGESPTMAERVVPRMIYALKVNGCWERVMVRSHCTASCCSLRMEGEEQSSPPEHWHVNLMEVGSMKCVALSQLALITREIASETPKARLYYLSRIYLEDDEKNYQAKAFLKSQIMNNQRLTAEVSYPPSGRGLIHVEIVFGNAFLSDALVDAGFAKYTRFRSRSRSRSRAHDQRKKVSKAASCCSSQDKVSVSSRNSLVPRVPLRAPRNTKPDIGNSTLPELMELIDHMLKKRNESAYLTSRHSALNIAIKLSYRERVPQHQGLCEDGYTSLDKYQKLLRRLRNETPYVEEIMDVKESLYKQLLGMFKKWKASNRHAQKKSDVAIDIMANIFLRFTNTDFIFEYYRHECKKLETSLSNELLLKNEGQGLAQMIVPAVATKLMAAIEKLETSGSGFMQTRERAQTLHHFIINSRNINSLALDTLAKDILKGLYCYHMRGIAYKYLHPENVLVINGHAELRTLDDLHECTIGKDWPFGSVKMAKEDLGKPGDVFKFGLLVLWMACIGVDSYRTATMKFHCNMALLKTIMAQDPNKRPLVESMVCMNSPIIHSSSQGCSMPLKYHLKEVFSDMCIAEGEEETSDQPSEMEVCSESESMFQPTTEEESGNETTESEAPRSNPPSLLSAEREAKDVPPPSTPTEKA
ncbi:uncharacterized protein LOC126991775 isoform X1 [Eriocheir sinensis]|uniref:uncharacterized protein LOC126991775 isoform X1 n=1 Tax=Eriocheir sinensis TaxID=95602 RepID=UPI0021C877B8|nr:uncharacterized protein LOC126991775 isoform X1 [Eriocheir sinensis]